MLRKIIAVVIGVVITIVMIIGLIQVLNLVTGFINRKGDIFPPYFPPHWLYSTLILNLSVFVGSFIAGLIVRQKKWFFGLIVPCALISMVLLGTAIEYLLDGNFRRLEFTPSLLPLISLLTGTFGGFLAQKLQRKLQGKAPTSQNKKS